MNQQDAIKKLKQLPKAHSAYHSTAAPNGDIFVAQEQVQIVLDNRDCTTTARFCVRLLPKPRFVFLLDTSPCPLEFTLDAFSSTKEELNLVNRNTSVPVLLTKTADEGIEGVLERPPLSLGSTDNLSSVTVHLLNFYDSIGSAILFELDEEGLKTGNRVICESDGWRVVIDSLPTTKTSIKVLRDTGGHAITHVIKIERSDGASFTVKEVTNIIDCLFYFLSFARGLWSSPILPVGVNDEGNAIWEVWGVRLADPWTPVSSWFDSHNADSLAELFPGFLSKWNSDLWRNTISSVIYWYIKSNTQTAGTDGSIILTQAALERLAWTYLVQDKKTLSVSGFKRLPAADLFKLLLSHSGVPLEVPDSLQDLTKVAKEFNHDGPEAFMETRNSIVHPSHKKKDRLLESVFDSWNLGQQYIELILLNSFGYRGVYSNRLRYGRCRGEVQLVPWAS